MATITAAEKFECQRIESMSGWDIADHFGCRYDGDSDPITHGGFFYDARDWEAHGYANAVEFYEHPENGNLVVQRGTINKPDSPDEWESVWHCSGIDPNDDTRNLIDAQISCVKAASGMEPERIHYPDVMEFDLDAWQEWRIWRSVAGWIRALGE